MSFRLGLLLFGTATTALGVRNVLGHFGDRVDLSLNEDEGLNEWLEHTREQISLSPLSGMHRPFVTRNQDELKRFSHSFPDSSFLLFRDAEELIRRASLESSVRLSPVSSCPSGLIPRRVETLVVGGPPSLLSAVELTRRGESLIYLNEKERVSISNGSAWHLEEDAPTEAPTFYSPLQFFFSQLRRLFISPVFLREIGVRGEFPWRTLDWVEWLKHPGHWSRAVKIFFAYQWKILRENREDVLRQVAEECRWNEIYFQELNDELNGTLLDDEKGSMIIARTKEEVSLLSELHSDLQREGKQLTSISKKEFLRRYSFLPNGFIFMEKKHDRRLQSSFISQLEDYLRQNNVSTIDGRLIQLFVDEGSLRFALLRRSTGEEELIQFSRAILSLGNQTIHSSSSSSSSSSRLFDVIAARGVSMLCHLYVPHGVHLPSLTVCGGTNHLTRLNSSPIRVDDDRDVYLVRLTAGATITPNVLNERTAFYDSSIAVGLLRSVGLTLGERFSLHPLVIYGCNRQVSQHGQIHWFEPMKNIFIQYGAAGGGLTRATDFIHRHLEKDK